MYSVACRFVFMGIFILAGAMHVAEPPTADVLKGNLPYLLRLAGVALTPDLARILAMAAGAGFATGGLAVVFVGRLRRPALLLLALELALVTVCQHMSLPDVAATPLRDRRSAALNVSLIGAMLLAAAPRHAKLHRD